MAPCVENLLRYLHCQACEPLLYGSATVNRNA